MKQHFRVEPEETKQLGRKRDGRRWGSILKRDSVWGIMYPIAFYYLISAFVFFALNILLGESQEIYMVKQLLSSGATIPFLLSVWKQDKYAEDVVYGKKKVNLKKDVQQAVLAMISVGVLGAALNNFIAMTPLVQISEGFQSANENFFAGGIMMQILASCVVIPVAEELLFRGIVLKRVSLVAGEQMGMVISAILFGIIHMNFVQLLYAAVIGLLLAGIVTRTKKIWLAVLGHASANLIAILRASTGILDFSYEPDLLGIGFSMILAGAGSVAAVLLLKKCRNYSVSS